MFIWWQYKKRPPTWKDVQYCFFFFVFLHIIISDRFWKIQVLYNDNIPRYVHSRYREFSFFLSFIYFSFHFVQIALFCRSDSLPESQHEEVFCFLNGLFSFVLSFSLSQCGRARAYTLYSKTFPMPQAFVKVVLDSTWTRSSSWYCHRQSVYTYTISRPGTHGLPFKS